MAFFEELASHGSKLEIYLLQSYFEQAELAAQASMTDPSIYNIDDWHSWLRLIWSKVDCIVTDTEREEIDGKFTEYMKGFRELNTPPSLRKRKVHTRVLTAECIASLNDIYVLIRRKTQARGLHFRYWDKPSTLDDALEELDKHGKKKGG